MAMRGSLKLPGWQSTRGTASPNAKLDDDKVRAIRAATSREALEALAAASGISYRYAILVKNRERWRHVKDLVSHG